MKGLKHAKKVNKFTLIVSFTLLSLFQFRFRDGSFLPVSNHVALASPPASIDTAKENSTAITSKELKQELAISINKVDEFVFIREIAQELGVKVYLFGGTASAFAHYVKWDFLRRERNDQRFLPDRFDYKYINIYRSNQDLDIVVDGPTSAIDTISKAIVEHFPYLQGNKGQKSSWEVRSLREDYNNKFALLNNPDFLNQHTDSNSVGMIELTNTDSGQTIARDLRDWNDTQSPHFLDDIVDGKIHYYFSKDHQTTKYAKEGRNPPILSVIRYFIKVFQFGLTMRDEDLYTLKKIISDFEPNIASRNSYVQTWFDNNVPKLVQNSLDVEYTMTVLNEVGLLHKLQEIGSKETSGSVSWWMHKQPLVSFPLGQSRSLLVRPGATAHELGLDIVSHETTSFQVYEAITRSHQGVPNVLISRQNTRGEAAAYGDGFYTMRGDRSGFRGTGFTIRFKLNPNARANVDFKVEAGGQYIVILNRNAIRVIPENLKLDLIGYYSLLKSDEPISRDDLGVFHRLRLALRPHFANPSTEELEYLKDIPSQDLVTILEKDIAPESITIILRILPERDLEPGAIVRFLNQINQIKQKFASSDRDALDQTLNQLRPKLIEKFLAANPSPDLINQGLEIGIFKGNNNVYLETLQKNLSNVEEVLSSIETWNRYKGENAYTPKTRAQLAQIGKLFYSFHPNENDVARFTDLIPIPNLHLGLGARYFDDPLVLAMSLGQAGDEKLDPKKQLKVWHKKKAHFFNLSPTLSELTAAVDFSKNPEIQLDLLDWALEQKLFKRRREVIDFVRDLTEIPQMDELTKTRRDQLIGRLIKIFHTMNPTMTEVSQFFGSPGIGPTHQLEFFNFPSVRIRSEKELFELLKNMDNVRLSNQFLKEHPEIINQISFTYSQIPKFNELLDFKIGSHLILKSYFSKHPKEADKFFNLLARQKDFTYADNQSDLLTEAWVSTFENLNLSNFNIRNCWDCVSAIPNVDIYKYFLRRAIELTHSLNELSLLSALESLNRSSNRSVDRTQFPYSYSKELSAANSEVLYSIVKKEFARMAKNTTKPVYFYDIEGIVGSIHNHDHRLEILHLFMKHGVSSNSGYAHIPGDLRPFNNDQDRSPEWMATQIQYLIRFAPEIMAAPNHLETQSIRSILNKIQIFRPEKNSDLLISDREDLLFEVFRFYLLTGIRSLIPPAEKDLPEKSKTELNYWHLFSEGYVSKASPLNDRMKLLVKQLSSDFKDYPDAVYRERGGWWHKTWGAFSVSASSALYEQDLDRLINESQNRIKLLLAEERDLRQRFAFLEEHQPTSTEHRCSISLSARSH